MTVRQRAPEDDHAETGSNSLRYSVKEAARLLGVSESTVRKRIKAGTIGAEQDGKRWWVLLPGIVGTHAAADQNQADPAGSAKLEFASSEEDAFLQESTTAASDEVSPYGHATDANAAGRSILSGETTPAWSTGPLHYSNHQRPYLFPLTVFLIALLIIGGPPLLAYIFVQSRTSQGIPQQPVPAAVTPTDRMPPTSVATGATETNSGGAALPVTTTVVAELNQAVPDQLTPSPMPPSPTSTPTSVPAPLPTRTRVPATATSAPTPVPATATHTPAPIPATATHTPTQLPTPTITAAPTTSATSSPAPPTPTITTRTPTAIARSAAEMLQQVALAETRLQTGELAATIDYGTGPQASTHIRFDLGGPRREPRLHMTTTYHGGDSQQRSERIMIGNEAWQRTGSGRWQTLNDQEGVWGQIQGFLPHAAAGSNPHMEANGGRTFLRWYDTGRDADVMLQLDPATGVPRELQRVARPTEAVLTVTYSGWNTEVKIAAPTGI
jgi:excisionase family DNA binding protein